MQNKKDPQERARQKSAGKKVQHIDCPNKTLQVFFDVQTVSLLYALKK